MNARTPDGQPATARASGTGVRFPPPTLFVVGWLAGWLLEREVLRIRLAGGDVLPWPLALAGNALIVAGGAVLATGLLTFARARTAILPHRPASRLVTHGLYRFSRNPMYVGMAALHAGLALRANFGWPILLLPVSLAALVHLVIRREERYLERAFGEEYLAYKRRVRRWL